MTTELITLAERGVLSADALVLADEWEKAFQMLQEFRAREFAIQQEGEA